MKKNTKFSNQALEQLALLMLIDLQSMILSPPILIGTADMKVFML